MSHSHWLFPERCPAETINTKILYQTWQNHSACQIHIVSHCLLTQNELVVEAIQQSLNESDCARRLHEYSNGMSEEEQLKRAMELSLQGDSAHCQEDGDADSSNGASAPAEHEISLQWTTGSHVLCDQWGSRRSLQDITPWNCKHSHNVKQDSEMDSKSFALHYAEEGEAELMAVNELALKQMQLSPATVTVMLFSWSATEERVVENGLGGCWGWAELVAVWKMWTTGIKSQRWLRLPSWWSRGKWLPWWQWGLQGAEAKHFCKSRSPGQERDVQAEEGGKGCPSPYSTREQQPE